MSCPSLPTELFTQIIKEAATEVETVRSGSTYERNRNLRSFSLVCSQWRGIAQRELGREVTVGTERCLLALKSKVLRRWSERKIKRMQHLRFVPHGKHEGPLEEIVAAILWAPHVDFTCVSLLYDNVYQHKCYLLSLYADSKFVSLPSSALSTDAVLLAPSAAACCFLTSLAISHMELMVPEGAWELVHFPHLHTLDLRRVTVSTEDDDHFMTKRNDRSSEMMLPLTQQRTLPKLTTLRISGSGISTMNLGDFVEFAEQITDLSLGVYADHSFLKPELLHKFTKLESFEFDCPLDKANPLRHLVRSHSPLEVLRVRDWHAVDLTSESWDDIGFDDLMSVEWTPEPEVWGPERSASDSGDGQGDDTEEGAAVDEDDDCEEGDNRKEGSDAKTGEEEETDDEEDEEEDDEQTPDEPTEALRIDNISLELVAWIDSHFSDLESLCLPLKFGRAVADGSCCYFDDLVTFCKGRQITIRYEERHWETDLGKKKFRPKE